MGKQARRNNQTEAKREPENGFYGVEAKDSLQSVNFATTENPYLNEHYQEEAED
ncbi:hypothetical protein [Mesobacillus foraminis]|uniref:Uncharacterized protein n=1 Tax=Mesobacillus foraminis TaxID=279826 RepID=A0A4R2BJR4_9BACI|nr:hypothetical protein [Mesobacillus foraminis]TCN27226.1 hypothetical protein EV146_102173 [Mesobacillus foraminis]